jgi:hypothetical protein
MVLSERVTKSNVKIHPYVHQGMAAMADRPDVKRPCGPEIISLLTEVRPWKLGFCRMSADMTV